MSTENKNYFLSAFKSPDEFDEDALEEILFSWNIKKLLRLSTLIIKILSNKFSGNKKAKKDKAPTPKNKKIKINANLNLGWKLKPEKLRLLYNLLKNNFFIRCSYELFYAHFMSNDGSLKKIKWYGQDNELTYFFIFKLIDSEKIIPLPKRMYEKLCANFCMPDYACDMNNDPDDELGGIDYNSVSHFLPYSY